MVADGGDGFVGRVEVVRRTRGYRRWPEAVKARIVAESFQPGVRVVDVAQRHDLAPHQLSDWRRQARQGLLALPADAMEAVGATVVPAFVPVSVDDEVDASPDAARGAEGVVGIEIGDGIIVRVPGDVSAERAAALVRALRRSA
ncbi:transposase [Paracoccus sp. P2]|nr:transposase [Paracoccus pantotrophus]MDF3856578.1 transposase [Paracoccus pantotrophus]SFP30678.1 transposase [Paracoccus pantotrophus]